MGLGIKRRIKQLFPKPTTVPIINKISSGEELTGKVALISGGSGGISYSKRILFIWCESYYCGNKSKKA